MKQEINTLLGANLEAPNSKLVPFGIEFAITIDLALVATELDIE